MKTIETTVYEYKELSEKAKKTAYNNWYEYQCNIGFGWSKEYRETLTEFCRLFRIDVYNWDVYHCYYALDLSDFYADMPIFDNPTTKQRVRISKYLQSIYNSHFDKIDDCELTGYCADIDILSPFFELYKWDYLPESVESHFRLCLDRFFKAWSNDIDYSFSEDCFIENYANENEYLENGDII